jgi:hypothetical protein
MNPYILPFFRRFILLAIFSALLVWDMSELAYYFTRDENSRAPMNIELVIPSGTALRVAAGEPVPAIPDEMVFVTGDVLVVKNEDQVDHQLGPLFIPKGSNASLPLGSAEAITYTCSFQTSKYLGLEVRDAVTWISRLGALWYGTPPTLMFLLVYSFVIAPIKPLKKTVEEPRNPVPGEQR